MDISVGLIGSGFMGRAHAFAFNSAPRVFQLPMNVTLQCLADVNLDLATKAAKQFGFASATANWQDLISDKTINLISVTSPNTFHKEMSLAAIKAGKHVYCEKPLAPTASDCLEMTLAAEKAGVQTGVGFNYIKNPMMKLARDIIASGEIGEVRSFRGVHAEDYMYDENSPWTWRLDPRGGGGALADIGSHILETARYLLGDIASVKGETHTLIKQRPDIQNPSQMKAVEVDDISRANLVFANGAVGSIEANWIATGREMQHDFEIYGSKGGLLFTQERFNELHLFSNKDAKNLQGYRKIFAGPEHDPYGAFCIAGGHQIGFNDLKTIEARDLILAIAGEKTGHADFREGYMVQKTVEAIYESARTGEIRKL
ncbi:Gfo/Idh/MocA family oxidoreductase [Bartonella sp. HY329]|uniref:Gfo/Idh/MocA family protein n=1 Tax=unclassified Bartonella TaxID=2645622 RepID=UPI0021C5EEFD|nr:MULTISPECIES: Gfo/Idh/MocA family oxidoreductase [unclassified Bartonella]UXM94421.1 Gfo/Idh/MocA family oxidoreductase [Bartonella sp. HY329]UXN08745.1 Gfo/Idh/MocA family oxidoreductase [Bartonella sp. HY328]